MSNRPVLALTQGDPAGIGPEILLKLVADETAVLEIQPLLIAERVALDRAAGGIPPSEAAAQVAERMVYFDRAPSRAELESLAVRQVAVLDPIGERRRIDPGRSGAADAAAAVAAIDAAIEVAGSGVVDAVVTAPVSKGSIARHHLPGFRGHTEYLAAEVGLERYGRDYLMVFLTPDLQVALLTTHIPLVEVPKAIDREGIEEALSLIDRIAGGRIGVAGLNPHAGEGGLLGGEEAETIAPAIAAARQEGIKASGPESADTLFARARQGEFDWVLALYHDQGLIAVKTSAFGRATNWTLGLPFLRTSVDHGTAFDIAGRGLADPGSLREVVQTTVALVRGELPRPIDSSSG